MSVPPFDGNPATFQPWIENYNSSIAKNRRITTIDKFNILRQNLTGKPKQTIDALQPTEDNYQVALNLLIATYSNKDYRHYALYGKIKAFTRLGPNQYEKLQSFNNHVTEFYSYLRNIHSDKLVNASEFYQHILIRVPHKLRDTLKIAETERKRLNPDLHPLKLDNDNLQHAVQALHDYCMSKNEQQQQEYLLGVREQSKRPTSHMFATYADGRYAPNCAFCLMDNHESHRCTKKMTPSYARGIADRAPLCYRCLHPWIPTHACDFNCPICKQPHHKFLCQERRMNFFPRRNNQAPRFQPTYGNQSSYPSYRSRSQPSYGRSFNPRSSSYGRQSDRRSPSVNSRGSRPPSAHSQSRPFYNSQRPQPILRNTTNSMPRGRPEIKHHPTDNAAQRSPSTVSFRSSSTKRTGSQTSTPNKSRPKQKSFNITPPAFK